MAKRSSTAEIEFKLRDFCDRIGVTYRDARYALAHGFVPEGIDQDPGRGNHRLFNHRQAFWLAIVLKLKAAGIKPKLAAEMAKWAERITGYSVNLGWEWTFAPFNGQLRTEYKWFLEVGDASFVRILTDANPSREGVNDESGWVEMKSGNACKDAEPTVIVRIDLGGLSSQLLALQTPQ